MIYRFLDIETYSNLDIKVVSRKNYMEHPSFEINLIGWVDVDPDQPIDMKKCEVSFQQIEELTDRWKEIFINDFNNKNITLVAHNANFEVAAFERVLSIKINLNRVICTMVKCYQTGLPAKLDSVSKVLNLNYSKIAGINSIKYFANPCKATKVNKGRTRNMPNDNPVKWDEYKEYNKYDVLATIELFKVLINFPQPEQEHNLWMLDQKINKKGIKVDTDLIKHACNYIIINEKETMSRLEVLTGLPNPNSTTQLTAWFRSKCQDQVITSIDKMHLAELETNSEEVKEVIKLRQVLSKTSIKKYITLEKIMHKGVLYDVLQFSGTSTGRWAGRGFQVHNLPKNKLGKDLDEIRKAYREGKRPITENLNFELSQLLRTVLVPSLGKTFLVCDYAAIEARIAAWVAQEEWVLAEFRGAGKIYEATACKMFDLESHDEVTKEYRNDGKTAVLACGYGGGEKAIANFAPDWPQSKRQIIVDYWRNSNPNIVKIWKAIENAAKHTIKNKSTTKVNNIIFKFKKGCLLIVLPSGRSLTYVRAQLAISKVPNDVTRNGKVYEYESIAFEAVDSLSKKWSTSKTFGGKLFENIVQAIARDVLAEALLRLDLLNYELVFHVHDEIIIEMDKNKDLTNELEIFRQVMCILPKWAEKTETMSELPINAAGFITDYYKKEED